MKSLWLKNNTESDVSIGDLGVKVPANGTINVYKYNPYITQEQVKKSLDGGSLQKRIDGKILIVVKKKVNQKPYALDHVKSSTEITQVKRVKGSVVVDTRELDVLEDDDLGAIADYGLGDLGHENSKNVKVGDGVVVVKQEPDEVLNPDEEKIQKHLDMMEEVARNSLGVVEEEAVKPEPEVVKEESNEVMEDVSFDTKVATKTENGAVVMKVKTEDKVIEKPAKTTKKTTKKKTTTKKSK